MGVKMENKIILKNIYALVTCDNKDNMYKNVDILVKNGEIIKIEEDIVDESAIVKDCSNLIIYPGLVNTHHHFFQTF